MPRSHIPDDPLSRMESEQPDKEDQGQVVFLGRMISRDEYEASCRNLRRFFDLLKAWREGGSDESP